MSVGGLAKSSVGFGRFCIGHMARILIGCVEHKYFYCVCVGYSYEDISVGTVRYSIIPWDTNVS